MSVVSSTRGGGPYGAVDRARHNAWWLLEHVLTERHFPAGLRSARERSRKSLSKHVAATPGRVVPLERRRSVSRAEFARRYFRASRPVVLEGFASAWPAVRRWSFEWLAERHGDHAVCITDYGDPDFIPLANAIDRLSSGELHFARFGSLLHERPELLGDLGLQELERYAPRLSGQTSRQFFVAGPGSVSPLHADGTCNFHVQLRGEKVWRIIEPRFNPALLPMALGAPHFKSPLSPFESSGSHAAGFEVFEAVLRAGDVLFNPSFYWHEVRYREPSVSVGLRWASPTSFLRGSPMMALLMVLARNPTVIEALWNATRGREKGFYA